MKKTSKIKVISAIILVVITIITTIVISLSINTVKYSPNIAKPSSIVVYYNNSTQNVVFYKNDSEYNKIYSKLMESYSEPILKSFVNGNLNKKSKINISTEQKINFKGFNIAFVYNSPQVVKNNNKVYNYDDSAYWYRTLILKIDDSSSYKYNSIAIIPNENDYHYLGEFKYVLSFKAYANFNKVYDYIENLF